MTAPEPARVVTVAVAGRRYRIERRQGEDGPGSVTEFWPGHGVIGSHRRWLGDHYARRLRWHAAVNPAGVPHQATASADDFPTRRAAITWLLAHSLPTDGGAR